MVYVVVAGGDEAFEKWMRLIGFALKLGVKLGGDKEGVILQFNDFDEIRLGRDATEDEARGLEHFAISIVELVTMPMALVHEERSVKMRRASAHD